MGRQLFYRNIQARDHLEIFLISAISSVLLLRFYLYMTGYPQLGGGSLHIAHMLYGGLMMTAAIAIQLSFLGIRAQRLCALIGGLGFGLFIDELGKFITNDNNYFFRPAVGLIYATFIILYLIFNFLGRQEKLNQREAELNALVQFEEAVLQDLDITEKARLRHLLAQADPKNQITKGLKSLLEHIDAVEPGKPRFVRRQLRRASRGYHHFWSLRSSNNLVATLFIVEAGLFLLVVFVSLFSSFDSISDFFRSGDSYAQHLVIGQLVSSLAAGGFALAGTIRLASSRLAAFELFHRAILINLLLTEFFIFSRIQFGAIPGFLLNLVLLLALRYAISQERPAGLHKVYE